MANPIEFKLFAPYNQEAALIGSFSDWEAIAMQQGDDGCFRTTVDLEDGTHAYKFRVRSKSWFLEDGEWVDIIDPWATRIDPSAGHGILCVKDGQRMVDTYVWQHDDQPLPSNDQLVIYELHVGDFSGGEDDPYPRGEYRHVIEKLDYLEQLGVNAIELMPIMEFPGDFSWGYNPRYFFASESSYGSTADLKRLVDECHARGIRVILDCIFNHSESSSPLTQIDHDYWYHHSPRDPENAWGPEFNFEHYDENLDLFPARSFIGDVVRFWIQEYHIDGIRYDAARQLANYDFMHWITEETRAIAGPKPFYNAAEHIPETTDIVGLEGPMDGCWHESFYQNMLPHIGGDRVDFEQLKDILDPRRQGYQGATDVINYLTNHDQQRLMVELADRDIFGDAAFKRAKLGAALLMTAIGIPLIWMGEEFGSSQPKTQESSKIDWNILKNESNQNLLDYYRGLIELRKTTAALYTNQIEFFHADPDSKVLAYIRWNEAGSRVAVVANFSDAFLAGYTVPNFPHEGTWHEWTRDYDVEVQDGQLLTDLPEYEAQVFVS
ncbi:MAG: alpha-amylase family glycosyl hydrolase [Elainellaceae cyanobacterium]